MGLLDRYRLNAAAKRYARTLPAQIRTDYGASEYYTTAQVAASVRRARLPAEFIALGLAQYLPREVFDASVETEFSYDFLREKFKSYVPNLLVTEVTPPGMASGIGWLDGPPS